MAEDNNALAASTKNPNTSKSIITWVNKELKQ